MNYTHHKKCCLAILAALTVIFTLAETVGADGGFTLSTPKVKITGAIFSDPPKSWQSLSADRKTLKTTISSFIPINMQPKVLSANILISFGSEQMILAAPVSALVESAATGALAGKIKCGGWSAVSKKVCKMNATWAEKLTTEVIIPLQIKEVDSNTVHHLTWIIKPMVVKPFVEHLNAPPVKMGTLATFRVTLTQAAPSGGQKVFWKLIPGNCFEQAANGVEYQANTLNDFNISQGKHWADFLVKSLPTCMANSGRLETWVENFNTTASPYYKDKGFKLLKPPANLQGRKKPKR